jgi:DNA-binding response OmpR family regulator
VVESDPELQQRLGEVLREASYELASEAEGVWAKRSMLIRPPDAIILDTHLSDGSGFAIADALRRDPETARTPIFFIASRHQGAKHRSEARRRFAPAEYLTTPVDFDSLLARLLETVPPRPARGASWIPNYPGEMPVDPAQRRERREVEQEARRLSNSSAEMRGSLSREPFARLVQRIYADKRSGALLLAREQAKKIVYFGNGYPVSVRSNQLSECLGQILVARRMIQPQVLEESLRRMRREKRHQGEILVEMGALSPHNLQRALLGQMESKLYEIFAWRSGSFRFSDEREAPDQPVTLDKSPAAMILEGIRRHYDDDRQQGVLSRFAGQFVVPSQDPRQRLQSLTGEAAERVFIEGLDGSRKLEAVLAQPRVGERNARLLLVAMAEAGMIEPSRTPVRRSGPHTPVRRAEVQSASSPRARRPASASAAAPAAPAPAPAPRPVEPLPSDPGPPERRTVEELAAIYEGMRLLTHFDALGVGPDATRDEITDAFEERARDFHPDRFRRRSQEVRGLAQKIFDRLSEANKVLADPSRRRRYLAKVERQRSDPPPQPAMAGHSPPPAAEQVYYAGVEYLRQRRYREAVEAFSHALALAPDQASYHGALGWALFRSAPGDPRAVAAGLSELRQAVMLGQSDPWVHVSLGRFLAETGDPDQAVAELEIALRLNPALADVQDELRRLRGEA